MDNSNGEPRRTATAEFDKPWTISELKPSHKPVGLYDEPRYDTSYRLK
jgi:hypothetical protein